MRARIDTEIDQLMNRIIGDSETLHSAAKNFNLPRYQAVRTAVSLCVLDELEAVRFHDSEQGLVTRTWPNYTRIVVRTGLWTAAATAKAELWRRAERPN